MAQGKKLGNRAQAAAKVRRYKKQGQPKKKMQMKQSQRRPVKAKAKLASQRMHKKLTSNITRNIENVMIARVKAEGGADLSIVKHDTKAPKVRKNVD